MPVQKGYILSVFCAFWHVCHAFLASTHSTAHIPTQFSHFPAENSLKIVIYNTNSRSVNRKKQGIFVTKRSKFYILTLFLHFPTRNSLKIVIYNTNQGLWTWHFCNQPFKIVHIYIFRTLLHPLLWREEVMWKSRNSFQLTRRKLFFWKRDQ